MDPDDPKGSCGSSGRDASADEPTGANPGMFSRVTDNSTKGMEPIPGGEFLMGNEGDCDFPADGEGPVHAVTLDPFWIDATCVTNEQYNVFINATGYTTESEQFGGAFVFQGHLFPVQNTPFIKILKL